MPLLTASLAVRQSSGPGLGLLLFLLRKPVSSCLAPDNGISVCLKTNRAAPSLTDIYVCACLCVCASPHGHVWFANQQFLVPVSPLLLFLHLLLPQGSRQEVGSRSEAIVKGKPLASSCYERKCIQMCFLCVRPLSSPSSSSLLSHPCGRESATIPPFFLFLCWSWAFFNFLTGGNATDYLNSFLLVIFQW